jgi:hypothetical protein
MRRKEVLRRSQSKARNLSKNLLAWMVSVLRCARLLILKVLAPALLILRCEAIAGPRRMGGGLA